MKKGYAGFAAFISSFLALTSVGLFLAVIFKLQIIEKELKENFLVEVVLSTETSKPSALLIADALSRSNYCIETNIIDKEQALEVLKENMGAGVADFLETNPLYNSIQFRIKSQFLSSYDLALISTQIKNIKGVSEVNYSDNALLKLERVLPVAKIIILITLATIVFFALLVIFFITRLTLSFDKLKIETMKMFGAKRSFIAMPYIWRSVLVSFLASVMALASIIGIGYYLDTSFSDLHLRLDFLKYGIYSLSLVVFSILFIPLSTIIALIRYLKYQ
jgi:cell division transport system permease protein